MDSTRLLNDVLSQASGRYVAVALQVTRGLILAAILGPLGMGTVAAVLIILSWAVYSDLGVGEAVIRELPLALGEGDRHRAAAWKWYAVSAKVAGAVVVGTGLFLFALVFGDQLAPDFRFGLFTAAVVIVFQQFVLGEQLVMQGMRRFGSAAVIIILLPALSFALGVVGALIADVRGVFVGQVLAYAGTALAALVIMGLPRREILENVHLRDLVALGLPYALITFGFYNLVYLDQVMAGMLLGRADLGVYVIAQYAGAALYLVPQAIAVAIGPRLLARWGAEGRPEAIQEYTWKPTEAVSIFLPPLVLVAWLAAPPVITALLPEFAAAVGPLLVYTAAVFFLGVTVAASTTLYAFDRYKRNIPVIAAAIVLNVVLDLVFILVMGMGIEGIAFGSLFSYLFYWLAHTRIVAICYGLSVGDTLRRCLVYGWPGLLLSAVLIVFAMGGVLSDPPLAATAPLFVALLLLSGLRLRRATAARGLRSYLSRPVP